MADIFASFGANLNPWDPESIHYESRAKPIMNRRFDIVERQNDYQAKIVENSLADLEAEHTSAVARRSEDEIEHLIDSIVSLDNKAAKLQKDGQNVAAAKYHKLSEAKKARYKELTSEAW